LRAPAGAALRALEHASTWLRRHRGAIPALEAGARRLAITLGRALEVALLCEHAQECLDGAGSARSASAARRLAMSGVDGIVDEDDRDDAELLVAPT
jgi:hypothetical protein